LPGSAFPAVFARRFAGALFTFRLRLFRRLSRCRTSFVEDGFERRVFLKFVIEIANSERLLNRAS
jgi:hypothetical protein